jgi:2-polyprenyl-3-methyl-5-hydroxy-6-metoxy-1,4-benzoquinol methylase
MESLPISIPANYAATNAALWDAKTKHHIGSKFYDVPAFLDGAQTLKVIETELLGDVYSKNVLHLQCHFGQDALSLARMGAQVTGLDISGEAIRQAEAFAQQLQLATRFVQSDVYDAPNALNREQFDIVFTSYGTIGWLPDIRRWARVVADCLKPGGMFVFAEFHPAVWMFDNDFTYVQYSYFNRETIVETETGTYASREAEISLPSISWNHSLGEVLEALLGAGLQLQAFREFDYSPYDCFSAGVEVAPGKFQIKGMEGKLPMVYALKAMRT